MPTSAPLATAGLTGPETAQKQRLTPSRGSPSHGSDDEQVHGPSACAGYFAPGTFTIVFCMVPAAYT